MSAPPPGSGPPGWRWDPDLRAWVRDDRNGKGGAPPHDPDLDRPYTVRDARKDEKSMAKAAWIGLGLACLITFILGALSA